MTVSELITELQEYPAESEVTIYIYPHVLVRADETEYDVREREVVIS